MATDEDRKQLQRWLDEDFPALELLASFDDYTDDVCLKRPLADGSLEKLGTIRFEKLTREGLKSAIADWLNDQRL